MDNAPNASDCFAGCLDRADCRYFSHSHVTEVNPDPKPKPDPNPSPDPKPKPKPKPDLTLTTDPNPNQDCRFCGDCARTIADGANLYSSWWKVDGSQARHDPILNPKAKPKPNPKPNPNLTNPNPNPNPKPGVVAARAGRDQRTIRRRATAVRRCRQLQLLYAPAAR